MDKYLLIKYIRGNVSNSEKVKVMRWVEAAPENKKELLTLQKLYHLSLWQSSNEKSSAVSHRLLRKLSIEFVKYAAVLLVSFLMFKSFLHTGNSGDSVIMQTLHVPAGQRAQLTLADGTSVWLNANTSLSFPNHFSKGKRVVELDGEAYFDVTTDSIKPFYVQTNDYDIRVWGTEFNVMAYSNSHFFETALLEGSVEVMYAGGEKGVFIKPDERLYISGDKMIKGLISHHNHFLWKEGIISFKNASFEEIVKKLELYFDTSIGVENKSLQDYRYTGKFRSKDGVEHILKVLQISGKFNYKIDEENNRININ